MRPLLTLLTLLLPLPAIAHGFGRLYNLPVPLWLYGWGAAATLLVSFLVAALFISGSRVRGLGAEIDLSTGAAARVLRRLRPWLQGAALALLLLCIATGFFGHRDPLRNFGMIFFWVIFWLLFTYLTALFGNFYASLNPWRTLAELLGRVWPGAVRGRWAYPEWLAQWPALLLYLGFVAFELFGTGRPRPLAVFLSAYAVLNLAGCWAFGRAWFRHAEFFAVYFDLVGRMAPVRHERGEDGRPGCLRLRWPFVGLIAQPATHISTVVFALAMLSTTAFDGLRATQWWVMLFWTDPTGWLTAWAGARPINAIATVRPWYLAWEAFWLFVSPALYLAAFLLMVRLAKSLAGSTRPLRELALAFGLTLVPIAFVYNLTHYSTLLLSHGLKILSLISDPFGWRWDLFGTAHKFRAPILPDMGWVWHSQVGLILFGHVVSIWLSHRLALALFGSRRRALLSQLPMLLLMIGFTVAGLWILAQPLTVELMR